MARVERLLSRRSSAATLGLLLLAILAQGFRGHSPSLTEAGERYGTSRQNVKQIALGLEARGYVRLVADARDGRTTRLELTEQAGIFETPEMQARGAALLRDAFTGLEPRDIRVLQDIVHRWLAGLGGSEQRPAAHPKDQPDGQ